MTSFKRMTRGIKLLVEHVFDPVTSALQTMTGTGVPSVQYEKQEGTFRVNLSFPSINAPINTDTTNNPAMSAVSVPFILPPFQEAFGGNENDAVGYDLIEVSVSQDTRGEAGQLTPITDLNVGKPVLGTAVGFDLTIRNHKIDKTNFDSFSGEVFNLTIPEIALLNPYSRMNPHVQSGISIPFDSQNAYLVQLLPTVNTCMVSVFISLKFKTRLTTRDIGAAAQNQTPLSARNFILQNPVVPAGDSAIEADTADGVNTGFKLIDDFIDRRFRGGYNRAGSSQYKEGLAADACYDVISVPMFGGWPEVSGGPRGTITDGNELPFATLPWAPGLHATMDRALVPLHHPISIHHVIVACNYTGASTDPVHPYQRTVRPTAANAPNLLHEVGIGLMAGNTADKIAHEQVAFVQWTPATLAAGTNLIDRGDYEHHNATGGTYGYSWDLINCPIVGAATALGSGYSPQGKPIFAAAGNTATIARSNIDGGASTLGGGEQVLDIRWKISNGAAPGVDPATWAANQTIIGYGGCWIYLICKKTVV